MNWTRRTSQVVKFIYFYIKRERNVMSNDFKIAIIQQMIDVLFCAGKEIVYADDVVAVAQQMLA